MNIIVIGGGPAGMAAAIAAKRCGAAVTVLERNPYLGGVLPQCIHNGFGIQMYSKDMTGGEYSKLWQDKIAATDIHIELGAAVLSIAKNNKQWRVSWASADSGADSMDAEAVIVATGCRERTISQLHIPGSRPSGIMTAGSAQLMMNVKNYMPGRSAVILGSGDIGLIMARRMTLEGMNVKLVLGQKQTGLARNVVQCVQDFDIPMRYGWTIISTHGYKRLKGVKIAPMDEAGNIDYSESEYIPCDTLIVAAGLIPELELVSNLIDKGEGPSTGLWVCGNASYVHDLADDVTIEGLRMGIEAAEYTGLPIGDEGQSIMDHISSYSHRTIRNSGDGNMVCTQCPRSCIMQVSSNPLTVVGAQCSKGEIFAEQEMNMPVRVVTTVIKACGQLVPVRTDKAVPKSRMSIIVDWAKSINLEQVPECGTIAAYDDGTKGANLVSTNSI